MGRLHRAARLGKMDEVAEYLAQGDYVDAVSIHDFTVLMVAAQENQVAFVRQLLAAGADPDRAHPNGRRALHFAASKGHLDVVGVLTSHGANVNVLSNGGCTPAIDAAKSEHRSVVALLRRYDADLSIRGKDGLTADDWLERGGVFGWTKRDCPTQVSASLRIEQQFRTMMLKEPSAEAYAAKCGRRILFWTHGKDCFADVDVTVWANRVAEVVASPALLEECEERFLSGDDLEDARKFRVRREKNRGRRARQEDQRHLVREVGL